jgi:hypothetical protein
MDTQDFSNETRSKLKAALVKGRDLGMQIAKGWAHEIDPSCLRDGCTILAICATVLESPVICGGVSVIPVAEAAEAVEPLPMATSVFQPRYTSTSSSRQVPPVTVVSRRRRSGRSERQADPSEALSSTERDSLSASDRGSRGSRRLHSTASTRVRLSDLHRAVLRGNMPELEEALKASEIGGTLSREDATGKTALDLAAYAGQRPAFALIRQFGGTTSLFQGKEDDLHELLDVFAENADGSRLMAARPYSRRDLRSSDSQGSSISTKSSRGHVPFDGGG